VAGLVVALGIGLLVGLDRERRMAATGSRGIGGIRTFALAALLGAVAYQVGGAPVVVVALLVTGAAVVVGYARGDAEDRGMTTEVALLVTVLLGVLAQRNAVLAAGVAVVVTILLATRSGLHRFASSVLTEQEVRDGLFLGAAALVLWPLMPNRELAAAGGVNPFAVWRLVVLLMAVSAGGYVAVRAAGPRLGLPMAGLAGGFVSGTATIAAMGGRARTPSLLRPAIAGAVFSTLATVVQAALVFAVTAGRATVVLAWPLGLAALAAAVIATAFALRGAPGANAGAPTGRAFDPRVAIMIALGITVMTTVARIAGDFGGSAGLLVAASVGGLADAHAPVVAVASLVASGRIEASAAVVPVLAALTSNTVTKFVTAYLSGGSGYAWLVGSGLTVVLAAAWVGWAIASM
jgi:uncharacterized membrane protein (DUF4010 family)